MAVVATYTGHAANVVEAVNRYVRAEVKNRFTCIRYIGSVPYIREFVRVEVPEYAEKFFPGEQKKLAEMGF